eukprot:1353219-Amphidinium_carterae.2
MAASSSASSSATSNASVLTAEEYEEQKRACKQQKANKKHAAQASFHRVCVVGSSDSDGYLHVNIEDDDLAHTKNPHAEKEIKALEKKLALLRAISKSGSSSAKGYSTSDSSKGFAGSVGKQLKKWMNSQDDAQGSSMKAQKHAESDGEAGFVAMRSRMTPPWMNLKSFPSNW